jgi:Phage integrase, N-terminal SAM-like domain
MNQLVAVVIPPASALSTIADEELSAARSFVEMEKSAGTRLAYRSDFAIFTAWCYARDVCPLPASPGVVSAFLASEAKAGAKASTIGRRVAAIRYAHRLAGHEPPTSAETVRAVIRGYPAQHRDGARQEGACDGRRGVADAVLLSRFAGRKAGTGRCWPSGSRGPSADPNWWR